MHHGSCSILILLPNLVACNLKTFLLKIIIINVKMRKREEAKESNQESGIRI